MAKRSITKTHNINIRDYLEFSDEIVKNFENKAKNSKYLTLAKGHYVINYKKLQESLREQCPSEYFVTKFRLMFWHLKHGRINDAEENAAADKVFRHTLERNDRTAWPYFVSKNAFKSRRTRNWSERGFPRNGTFRNGFDLLPIGLNEGIMSHSTHAFLLVNTLHGHAGTQKNYSKW